MDVCRTGDEHLKSLRDGRSVYIDGERVEDVTAHPAFRNAVRSAASLYDFQARPENLELMTFAPDGLKRRINRSWQMPKTYDEMVVRRKAMQAWAGVSFGFMGRSPDHLASTLVGQRMGIEVFRRHGEARAEALASYFDYISRNDLFLTYVIVNPQADRSKAWDERDPGERSAGGEPAAAQAGRRGSGVLVRSADERQGIARALAQIL